MTPSKSTLKGDLLSRKNSPRGKNRSKKDPYLVFSSVSELKSHPLFAHLGEEWTKKWGTLLHENRKKSKTAHRTCQNRNGEMFRGVGNIGGTPIYIYRIEYWWLPLTSLYNKQKLLIKVTAKWFGSDHGLIICSLDIKKKNWKLVKIFLVFSIFFTKWILIMTLYSNFDFT